MMSRIIILFLIGITLTSFASQDKIQLSVASLPTQGKCLLNASCSMALRGNAGTCPFAAVLSITSNSTTPVDLTFQLTGTPNAVSGIILLPPDTCMGVSSTNPCNIILTSTGTPLVGIDSATLTITGPGTSTLIIPISFC